MFFFSSRRRHTRWPRDWSSDVCSSDLSGAGASLGGEPEESGFKVSEGRPPGLSDEIESIAVHASPALIAYGGVLQFFGPRQIGSASCRERVEIVAAGQIRM